MSKRIISLSLQIVLVACCVGTAFADVQLSQAQQAQIAGKLAALKLQFKGIAITKTRPAVLPLNGGWEKAPKPPTGSATNKPIFTRPSFGPKIDADKIHQLGDGKPKLVSIAPEWGKPGDTITIAAQYISTDTTSDQIWFEFNKTTKVQATILSATPGRDSTTLKVKVPALPTVVLDQTNGTAVYLLATDSTPAAQSNSVYFFAVPTANPALTATVPTEIYPYMPVTLKGNGFQANAELTYTTPDGEIHWADPIVTSSTEISTIVPHYWGDGIGGMGRILIQNRISKGPSDPQIVYQNSNELLVKFLPNNPRVTSLSPTEAAAGEPILVNGIGFTYPEVKFLPDGPDGYVVPGKDMSKWQCTIVQWNENQILLTLPTQSGITAATHGKLSIIDVGGGGASAVCTMDPAN